MFLSRVCYLSLVLCLLYGVSECKDGSEILFPKMYDYERVKCDNHSESFCEIGFTVAPRKYNSELWKIIAETQNSNYRFRRDRAYRILCVPINQDIEMRDYVKDKFYSEITNQTFKITDVDIFNCRGKYKIESKDYYMVYCLAAYGAFVLLATYLHYSSRNGEGKGVNKYIQAFSLIESNEQIRKQAKNPLYVGLKSVQGIRTYHTMFVIMGHSIMNFFTVMVSNPEYLESMYEGGGLVFFTWGMFLVQTFFLLSGWMMMFYFLENAGKLKLHHYLIAFVYRILRLWPSLIFSMFIHRNKLARTYYTGLQTALIESNYNACNQNWWKTLFFLVNYEPPQKMCSIITWYLAADTQNFILALAVLYVIFKFKLPVIRSLLATVVVSIIMQMWIMWVNDLDVIYRVTPENFLLYNILKNSQSTLYLWYLSALSNTPSFFLGLIFATIYYRYNNAKIFKYTLTKLLWFVSVVALLAASVILPGYTYNQILIVVLGSILKPMYALGIAILILGMSQGMGGIFKKLCENRVVEIISGTTYTIYLYHFFFVFDVFLQATTLVDVTMSKIEQDVSIPKTVESIKDVEHKKTYPDLVGKQNLTLLVEVLIKVYLCIFNVFKCFILGFIASHFVELPWNNLIRIAFSRVNDKKNK